MSNAKAAPPSTPPGIGVGLLVLGLALVEGWWFLRILQEPLPSVAAQGGRLRRSDLLWRALPGVVPGVRRSRSHLGAALDRLGHVENVPQRVPLVLAAGGIAAAAVALGRLVLRALRLRAEVPAVARGPLAFALGTTGLGSLTLLLGRLGGLAPGPVRLALAVPIAAELGLSAREWRRAPARRGRAAISRAMALRAAGFGLVAGPFLLLMALGAMVPAIEFDALEYHLQGPKEFYQAGRIAFLPHNVYTSMPLGVEMLHLLGMEVCADWWSGALVGQLLVMLHAPAAAALIGLTARRLGSPRAGWVAAVVYLTTPWIHLVATIPYVEGPLVLYHAALIWTLTWMARRDVEVMIPRRIRTAGRVPDGPRCGPREDWALLGLLAGGAMACKYPALVSAVVPFGVVALGAAIRRRSAAGMLAYVAGVAVAVGLWLVRNLLDTGNPVYPLGYGVFGGRHWDAARQAQWASAHGPGPATLAALGAGLLDLAGRSDWQSPLYAALAPLAPLRPGSRRAVGALWGYVVYLFATWFLLTHRLDRFWLPALAPLAVLAGMGANWTCARGWTAPLAAVLAVGIAPNLVAITTELAGLNRWTDDLRALRAEVPRLVDPPLARLDAVLPPGARVLLVGQASVFQVEHAIVYNTVFNPETIEALARGRSPAGVRRALADRGIMHVYVDWAEIARYRRPGNYGYSDFVTPELFAGLVRAGVLGPPGPLGPQQELYRVR